MCWNIHLVKDGHIVIEIKTAKEAVELFGAEAVRFNHPVPPEHMPKSLDDWDHCLCPIDTDYLLDQIGYVAAPHEHPLWDSMNTVAIEKPEPPTSSV